MIPSSKPLRSAMHCTTIYHTAFTIVLYSDVIWLASSGAWFWILDTIQATYLALLGYSTAQ